jgi:hypothetical protein
VTTTVARRRQYSYRRLGRRGRFNVAVLLTIVVVTYLLVPWVVSLVDAARSYGYGPGYYEPKDHTRQEHILRHGLKPVPVVAPWQLALNIGLVFVVVIVWVTVLPSGARRH